MREKLKGALAFFQHEAAGGLVLVAAAVAALIVSNSPLDWLYERLARHAGGRARRPAGARQAAAAVDQRRPDGRVLLPRRPRDQARAAAGRAVDLRPGGAAGGGRGRRHGRAGADLRRHQRRRPRRAQGLGHSVGHRHRLRRRRAGAAGTAHPVLAQDVPAGAGDPRRPGRHPHHRALLHGRPALDLAAAGGCRRRRSAGAQSARRDAAGALSADGRLHLGVRAEVGRARDARRRRRRHRHPADGRKAAGEPSLLEQLEESLHPWVAFAILPLFAFANAGVSLQGLSLAKLLEPVPLGIALGLFIGKPIGIFAATWLAVVERPGAEAGGRELGSARWASACWAASASP